jgi:predicted N-acetyltransferase YhbS
MVAAKRYRPGGFFYKWAEKQINLSVLTVLADFRHQGVSTMIVQWGIKAAEEKGWPVMVYASPLGALLYVHLKFVDIGTEVIQVEDEQDSFSSAVMVLYPEEEYRSRVLWWVVRLVRGGQACPENQNNHYN